jgi:glycolate oxidase iron-sulfur subunit
MRTAFSPAQLDEPHIREANHELRKCVHCGFCTAVCPTYVLTGDERDSPRGRIALIQTMLESNAPPAAESVHHLDRCLSCLGCRTICPSTVDYAALIDTARAHIENTFRRPWPERRFRAVLSYVMARPRVFALAMALGRITRPFANLLPGRLSAMATKVPKRKPLSRAHRTVQPPASATSHVALLPGCVQRVLAPEIDLAARRVLARQGIDARPLRNSGCCGALAFHLGKAGEAKAHARRLIEAVERAGTPDAVLITATGCAAFLKDYGRVFADEPEWAKRANAFASRIRDFAELAAPPGSPGAATMRIAYQPPCSLQFGQRLAGQGEALLAAAGFTLAPVADAHLCCGSAGSYSLTQPALSSELRARKLAAIAAAEPEAIASGNIGCITQLAGGIPAVHIAELLDWAAGGPRPPAFGGPALTGP